MVINFLKAAALVLELKYSGARRSEESRPEIRASLSLPGGVKGQ